MKRIENKEDLLFFFFGTKDLLFSINTGWGFPQS
jgi:hypothetical protein